MAEVLPPAVMADAIASIWQADDWRPALANFRAALLEPTLRRAASQAPFYTVRIDHQRLDGVFDEAAGDRIRRMYGLLRELPIIDRSVVQAHQAELLIDDEDGRVVRATSGSSGVPLTLFRSRAEIQYADAVSAALGVHNAALVPAFDGGDVMARALGASVRDLIELTGRLVDSGFDFGASPVEQITSHLQLLTRGARDYLERIWGRPLTDRYSLTEIVGGATSCPDCGGLHFDPWLVPELVEVTGPRLRDGGEGRLLLTSLYPFARMQPMIRYDTGDLFRVESSRCLHDFSWFPLGRVERSLHDGNLLLASELDLRQAIEAAAAPLLGDADAHTVLACANCQLAIGGAGGGVHIAIDIHPDRIAPFLDRLRAALASERPKRAAALAGLPIDVQPTPRRA